jgi:hypothetical protein
MTDLKRRFAYVERIFLTSRRRRIIRVIIENCPDGLSEDDPESGNLRYRRTPDETVEAFREREQRCSGAQACNDRIRPQAARTTKDMGSQ